jgi:hypothetical protein
MFDRSGSFECSKPGALGLTFNGENSAMRSFFSGCLTRNQLQEQWLFFLTNLLGYRGKFSERPRAPRLLVVASGGSCNFKAGSIPDPFYKREWIF